MRDIDPNECVPRSVYEAMRETCFAACKDADTVRKEYAEGLEAWKANNAAHAEEIKKLKKEIELLNNKIYWDPIK